MKSSKRSLLKSTQIFVVAGTVLLTLLITVLCIGFTVRYEVDTDVSDIDEISYWKDDMPPEQAVWFAKGIEELQLALHLNRHKQVARNAIVFLASGIRPAALAAARFRLQQGAQLSWDVFPHHGRLKNTCSNADICDAFSTATALFGGVRTSFHVGGFDESVGFRNCTAASNETHRVSSIVALAQRSGLRTGFITTGRVTGAAVAALYAHSPDTSWECDATMPKGPLTNGCRDVAQQLVEGETGDKLNVVMGGGRQMLVDKTPKYEWDPIDDAACKSTDGRNLVRDWQKGKLVKRQRFAVLQSANELDRFNGSRADFVLGIFANGNLRSKRAGPTDRAAPKLQYMVTKSLETLRSQESGYMLIVENELPTGSSIGEEVEELVSLNAVIEQALKDNRDEDTLVLAVFTRGTYSTPTADTSVETEIVKNFNDFANDDDAQLDAHLKDIPTETMVYAKGPSAFLFHGVHEETYLAHVVSFALKLGQFHEPKRSKSKKI